MTADTQPNPNPAPQDCRSEQGVLVGLIDGMIAAARVVSDRLRHGLHPDRALADALADLAGDEDVAFTRTWHTSGRFLR